MAPEPVQNANRRFVVTRVDAGVETNLIVSTALPANYTTDKVVRDELRSNAIRWMTDNPGVHIRIYSPANVGTTHTDSDLVYDSEISGPLFPVVG